MKTKTRRYHPLRALPLGLACAVIGATLPAYSQTGITSEARALAKEPAQNNPISNQTLIPPYQPSNTQPK